jgi:hypothetical protein
MHAISNAYSGILSSSVACPMMSLVVYLTASIKGEAHSKKLFCGRFAGSTFVKMSAVSWNGTRATRHSWYIWVIVCGSGRVWHIVLMSLTSVFVNVPVYDD